MPAFETIGLDKRGKETFAAKVFCSEIEREAFLDTDTVGFAGADLRLSDGAAI